MRRLVAAGRRLGLAGLRLLDSRGNNLSNSSSSSSSREDLALLEGRACFEREFWVDFLVGVEHYDFHCVEGRLGLRVHSRRIELSF